MPAKKVVGLSLVMQGNVRGFQVCRPASRSRQGCVRARFLWRPAIYVRISVYVRISEASEADEVHYLGGAAVNRTAWPPKVGTAAVRPTASTCLCEPCESQKRFGAEFCLGQICLEKGGRG